MADVLRTIKIRIRKIFGDDSLDWFESSYVIDWYVQKMSVILAIDLNDLQDRRVRIIFSRQLCSYFASL
jgi:hypothetical protein